MFPALFIIWMFFLYVGFSDAWPRPFDDCKEAIFYIGGALFCLRSLWKKRNGIVFPLHFLTVVFVLYLFIGALSINTAVYEGWLALSRILIWAGLTWSLIQLSREEKIRLVGWSTFFAAGISVFNFMVSRSVGVPDFLPPIGNLIYYGDFMVLHLPFAGYLLFTSPRWKQRVFWGSCFLLITMGLWMSGTRMSLFGMVGGAVVCITILIFYKKINWKKALLSLAVLSACFTFFHFIQLDGYRDETVPQRIQSFFKALGAKDLWGMTGDRWPCFANTAEMIRERPWLGWGMGNFRFIYPEFAKQKPPVPEVGLMRSLHHPFNEGLHQWAELGIVGLLLFSLWWMRMYFSIFRELKKSSLNHDFPLILACCVGLTIALFGWQMNPNFLFPVSRWMVSLYLAFMLSSIFSTPMIKTVVIKKPFSLFILGCFLLLSLFFASSQAGLYASAQSRKIAVRERNRSWAKAGLILAPGAFYPMLRYTTTHLWSKEREKAWPVLEKMSTQYPSVPIVLYQNGIMHEQKGDIPRAIQFMEHARRNVPKDPIITEWFSNLSDPKQDHHKANKTFR